MTGLLPGDEAHPVPVAVQIILQSNEGLYTISRLPGSTAKYVLHIPTDFLCPKQFTSFRVTYFLTPRCLCNAYSYIILYRSRRNLQLHTDDHGSVLLAHNGDGMSVERRQPAL